MQSPRFLLAKGREHSPALPRFYLFILLKSFFTQSVFIFQCPPFRLIGRAVLESPTIPNPCALRSPKPAR